MEIVFNPDNSISILDKEGKLLLQQHPHEFDIDKLNKLNFSKEQMMQIKSIIEKRKFSFY